ncbi:MAG: VCBS repeat-containing protein, partial [Nitrospirae bacterium]|nr:VCBS repeat-containing protein [Nitrospirota bacterium]
MVKKLSLIPLIIYASLISTGCVSLIESYKSDTHLKNGVAFADKRKYDRAEAALIKSLRYNQKNAEAWVALGDVYFTIENYEGARHAYKEALRYDRDAFGAYVGLWAVRLEESGYSEKAKEEVEIDIEVFMNSGDKGPERLMAAFRGFSFLHKNERTDKIAEEIMGLDPDEEIRSTLSNYLSENILPEKDAEKRLKMIDDFLRLFPSGKERHMVRSIRMSIAAEELKDKERLFQFGEEWIRDEPDNRRANFSVGYWYTKKDIALEMAVSYLKKALILINNPDPADKPEHYPDTEWHKDLKKAKGTYYDTLGLAYYKLGRYKDAEKAYKRGVKLLEYDKDLYYHQGLLLEENGEIYGAIDSYVQAHQSGENKEAEERLMALYPFIKGRTTGLEGLLVEEPPNKFFAKKRGVTSFTDVTREAGLSEARASRVAWGDYNNDGYEDILFNGTVLFKNNGNGTFTDVTKDAGIGGITGANGGLWGDFNNDGNIDFYTFASGKGSTDRFWRNNGDGAFTDITPTALADPDTLPTEAAAWGDYDNDGLIDIYIANYERPLSESVARARCRQDRLLRNAPPPLTGGGTGEGESMPAFMAGSFTDISALVGTVSPEKMCGRGVNWGDYDNDGDPDIYVANYRLDPNFLWRNNGDGTFTNVAMEAGVEGNEEEGYYGHSIGAEWGDYDNDGDLDLFVSNLAHPRYIGISNKSMLLENQGPPAFRFIDR